MPNEGLCFRNTRLLRQLDEAAVGVAHVGGATPREVARPVQRDARRGQRGGVLVEAFEGERDVVVRRWVAGIWVRPRRGF